MGEHKGFLVGLAIFIFIIVPGILMFAVDEFQRNAFIKHTTEFGEIVKEEGGVTEKVAKLANSMQNNGYVIEIKDENGNRVNSAVEYGKVLHISFKYQYLNFFGAKELKTNSTIPILRRDSKGNGEIAKGGVYKIIILKSNEFEDNGAHIQTFSIPGMKSLRSITSNTGTAEVVNVAGTNVVVRMKDGDPTRQEEIQDGQPEQTKYIEDYDKPFYEDKEGFRGELEPFLKEGEYHPSEAKYISGWDSPNYEDEEGFKGTLEKTLVGGLYLEEDWKDVTETVKVGEFAAGEDEPEIPATYEYNKDFYEGILQKDGEPAKNVISGTPEDSKTARAYATHYEPVWNKAHVIFDSSVYYEKDEYSGTLYLQNVEWMRIPQAVDVAIIYTSYSTDSEGKELHEFDYDEILQKASEQLGLYDNNPTVKSAEWTSNIESGSFVVDDSFYSYKREAMLVLTLDGFIGTAHYEGTVDKPDTRVWEVLQTYSGTVHRPEMDLREYKYQGFVIKPEVDTRVYGYRGYVTKPATPNSGAMKNYYQYTLTVEYEVWE